MYIRDLKKIPQKSIHQNRSTKLVFPALSFLHRMYVLQVWHRRIGSLKIFSWPTLQLSLISLEITT